MSKYTKPGGKLHTYIHKLHTTKFGWGTWIRTKIDGVRVRCSTIKLFPSTQFSPSLADFMVYASVKMVFMIMIKWEKFIDNKER